MSEDATSSTLLTYAVISNPDPIQVSNKAKLTIVVSNSTKKSIQVNSIVFSIPVGLYAKDLTVDASSIGSTVPKDWSINREGGRFTATPNTTGKVGPDGLSFALSNVDVNDQVGTALFQITEDTEEGGSRKHAPIPLAKFPAGFRVSDLNADPLIVNPGGNTTLSWGGSKDANYTLKYASTTVSDLPAIDAYPVDDLQETTLFNLIVTATVGTETATIQRQRTVTVNTVEIQKFDGPHTVVVGGSEVELVWVTINADYCQLLVDGNYLDKQAPANSTGYKVTPSKAKTVYTLYAYDNEEDSSSPSTVTVYAKTFNVIANVTVKDAVGGCGGVAVSPDGSRVYVANNYGNGISIMDASTNQFIRSVNINSETFQGVAVSPDGSKVYTIDWAENGVAVIDVHRYRVLTKIRTGNAPYTVVVHPNGQRLYVINRSSNTVSVIDTSTNKVIKNVQAGGDPNNATISRDGARLYVTNTASNALSVMNTSTNTMIHDVKGLTLATSVAVIPDGSKIYVSSLNNVVFVIDASSYKVLQTVSGTGDSAIAVSPDGAWIYNTLYHGNMVAIQVMNDNAVYSVREGANGQIGMAVSPDGSRIYISNERVNKLTVIETSTPSSQY